MKHFRLIQLTIIFILLIIPANLYSVPAPQGGHIGVNGWFSPNKTKKNRSTQGTVELDIPSGYHVNSNRPLEKFLIPTQLKLEVPKGVRVGAVTYPRAILRSLKFSKSKVAVFEGKAPLRFSVTVPTGYSSNSVEVKARLRYQACNDEVCFPPQNKDLSIWLNVE